MRPDEHWSTSTSRPAKRVWLGKVAETLRTPFDGDLLDAITTFERKIMIYEAQSRETISDSLKIGCVIAGMGQNIMREHLLSATACDSGTNFVREIESIEHARKTITAPTPMDLDAFQGNCHKCGKYGHTAKECRSSNHGGAEKPQCAHGQCWTRSYTSSHKDSQKGGWQGDRKGNGKGTQKGGKFKGGKGGNQGKGKGKGKKGQRLNEITGRKSSGQVDLGNNGQNTLGMLKQTLRVAGTMSGTQQIRILRGISTCIYR